MIHETYIEGERIPIYWDEPHITDWRARQVIANRRIRRRTRRYYDLVAAFRPDLTRFA